MAEARYPRDSLRAVIGGVVALAVAAGMAVLLAATGPFEADRLLESLRSVLPFLAGSSMSASATVLALMLTVLGIGHRSEQTLSTHFYRRVQWIGRQATATLTMAGALLLTMAVPIAEMDDAEGASTLLQVQYYATALLTGLLIGVLVAMVLMLESTLSGLVRILGLQQTDHWLVAPEDSASESSGPPGDLPARTG
jgi:hypothetical protein